MKETLNKFFTAPGLCSVLELGKVKKFLVKYKEYNDLYKEVTNREPLGFTLDVELDSVNRYIERIK